MKKSILILIAALAAVFPSSGLAAQKMPNIVLILADDMGWGDAGFNGCTDFPTPAMDAIAAGGGRFSEGYVMVPQCAPSRAALLTGKDQNRILANSNVTMDIIGLPDYVTMPDLLRKAGYRTGMVGKWHLGDDNAKHPTERGFDWFFGFRGGDSFYYPSKGEETIQRIELGTKPAKVTQYLTDEFGDRALQFIEESKDQPFFLYLSFNAPHKPMQAPKEEIAKFAHLESQHRYRPTYAAMMTVMDRNIQRVLDKLESEGIADNTIVVFLSDNGGPTTASSADNGPLRGVKGDTLEGGIRVPFAIKWPAVIRAGKEIDRPVLSVDLLPTFLAAAGVSAPAHLDGVNLLPALTGEAEVPERALNFLFTHSPSEAADRWVWAARDGVWKLVCFDPRDGSPKQTALFNLKDDLGEKNDLTSTNPEIRERLQKQHDAWSTSLPTPFSNVDPAAIQKLMEERRKAREQQRRNEALKNRNPESIEQ